jgi:hypothetical protein
MTKNGPRPVLRRALFDENIDVILVGADGSLYVTVMALERFKFWLTTRAGWIFDRYFQAANSFVALLVISGLLLCLRRLRKIIFR